MKWEGIDVSKWQGVIDWDAVAHSGVKFAILKAGGSDASVFYKDATFESNYSNAKRCGVHVGAYYFVGPGCVNAESGAADARRFIEILRGKQLDMPVYIDFEAPSAKDKVGNTAACAAFCEVMEEAGYFAGIYSSDISGFVDRLNMKSLEPWTWWVARYGSEPKRAVANLHIWQKSSKGRVNGIAGDVDLDECYVDFPSIIKARGLNGYKASGEPQPVVKTIEQRVSELEARVSKLEGR